MDGSWRRFSGVVGRIFPTENPEQIVGEAAGPNDGERDQRHQEGKLARVGDAGVLDVEAAGLGIAEFFDTLSLPKPG